MRVSKPFLRVYLVFLICVNVFIWTKHFNTLKAVPKLLINYIDPEIKPYHDNLWQMVEELCPKKANHWIPPRRNISIEKINDGNVVGLCQNLTFAFSITVDKTYFKYSSDTMRYEVMAHEMGHCYFGLDHVDQKNNYMAPVIQALDLVELLRQWKETIKKECDE